MKEKLPRNVRLVGQAHCDKKVFIEEYVVFFLQELIKKETQPNIVVFFGDGYEKDEIRYYFLQGAAAHSTTDGVLKKTDEYYFQTMGKRYFPGLKGIGWYCMSGKKEGVLQILQGLREQDFRDIEGYYLYIDKNENMEDYMIHRKQKKEINSGINFMTSKRRRENEAALYNVKKRKGKAPIKKAYAKEIPRKGAHTEKPPQKTKAAPYPRGARERATPFAAMQMLNIVSLCILIICCIIAVTTLNQYDKMKRLEETVTYLELNMEEQKKLPDE